MQWTTVIQGYFEQLLAGHTADTAANTAMQASIDAVAIDAALAAADAVEIEHHLHSRERWLAKLAVPAGNKVTDSGLTSFQIDSGNNTWGNAVLTLDTADTPVLAGKTYFDLHRLFFTATERSTVYRVQLIWGASAAAGVAAGTYSEVIYRPDASTPPGQDRSPIELQMPRLPAGSQVWARCWNAENTGTMDFMLGIHEYDA